jgi:hypothetical protein
MGTGADLVCARRGVLYVVEVKCGWDAVEYERGGRRMRGAAGALPDSPRNQHLLQALVTRSLFRGAFGGARCEAAVARVSARGVHFYRPGRALERAERAVVQELAARIYAERERARLERR